MTKIRVDQKLAKTFRKDESFESILASMNNCLAQEQGRLLKDRPECFPTLHIVGVPRSGTTLATQLISSCLPVGYINNLIAAFWKAPVYGIELSKKLLGNSYKSNFKSTFGRTDAIREPHEFGYFWNYHLRYDGLQQKGKGHEKKIDWALFSRILNNMTYHFNSPIVFKSVLFGFHANRAFIELPKSCFIYIKRKDFLANAFSLLRFREKLNGDIQEWGSIRPLQYKKLKDLSVYEQIAGQILCLEHEYLKQLSVLPDTNRLLFYYEDICKNPHLFIEKISYMLGNFTKMLDFNVQSVPSFNPVEVNEEKYPRERIKLFLDAKEKIKNMFPNLLVYESIK